MKMTYIKPEIKEVHIKTQQMLAGSDKIYFKKNPDTQEEEEVSDFDDLL